MTEKIILAGFGGQGMMLLGKLLAQTAMTDDKYVTYFPSYGTEVRGGRLYITLLFQPKKSFLHLSRLLIPLL
ncbi:MAG: 2-oxoacid:acceptor oxidoreductase family protein [Candidatus Jettenia sp.]|nr:MAG: 2-oxoacid:acceptor oxidoreductase family protein [Candidatus Jettenia sp.]